MKKTIIVGIAFLCLFLSACQATPEKDIVVQQDQNLSEAVSGMPTSKLISIPPNGRMR